ncbi:MAG TPA: TSUP family transporter [Ktedonobacterales bacterium]|nr:TSUP family transporter [Ktedonobacterales bacterium]
MSVMKSASHSSEADRARQMSLVRQAELIISHVLRGGVLLSAAVILLGVALYYGMPQPGGEAATLNYPHSLGAVIPALATGSPEAIITLGLLILLATPVARVAVSIIAFALERDWIYVGITALVLMLLLASILALGSVFGHGVVEPQQPPSLGVFALIAGAAIVAGLIGSLVGLGGGVLVVPLLTLAFAVYPEVAVGVSIVSVIATSSGAAAAYVKDHITNMRVGMFLEIATTTGAIAGAFLAIIIAPGWLFIIFGVVLLVSALPLIIKIGEELPVGVKNDRWADRLALASSYPDAKLGRTIEYQVTRVPAGFSLMGLAGVISGLLGIGSGTFKVLAMDTVMRLPMKVSTTTSNFMIGVTAAASAGIYFQRGAINPLYAAPIALGVLLGATIGAKSLARFSNSTLRKLFVPILAAIAVEMLIRGASYLLGH